MLTDNGQTDRRHEHIYSAVDSSMERQESGTGYRCHPRGHNWQRSRAEKPNLKTNQFLSQLVLTKLKTHLN